MAFDPDFSVYELIKKQHSGNIFLTELNHMYHLSRIIERDVLNLQLDAPYYVGFQCIHNLIPILERYEKIGEVTQETHIFAVPDARVSISPDLNLIPIALDSKLAKEWFLVINHPDYAKILSAREIYSGNNIKSKRQFEAILTHEPDVVEHVARKISESLSQYVVVAN